MAKMIKCPKSYQSGVENLRETVSDYAWYCLEILDGFLVTLENFGNNSLDSTSYPSSGGLIVVHVQRKQIMLA